MELTPTDIFNSLQLGIISHAEAREQLGFPPLTETTEEGK